MIIDRPDGVVSSPRENDEMTALGLVPQVVMMSRALWAAPVRNTLLVLAIALFVVIVATAYGQIRLNSWNQPFYDALAHRNLTSS
jgi:putative ATP-binding cassette transporter